MNRCFAIAATLTLLFVPALARADGLIFRLPPDGTWAAFDAQSAAEMTPPNAPPQKLEMKSTVTLSSVGRLDRFDQSCRWIELRIDSPAEKGAYKKLVLKILVPEQYLGRGQDPLAHGMKTFFSRKDVDEKAGKIESFIDEGVNRVQYEIDRLRTVFPPPLENVHSLPRQTINAAGREWRDCEVIEGTSHYDGPLLADGWMVYDGKYRLILNPAAPFGLVAMEFESSGREYSRGGAVQTKLNTKLTLARIGDGAISELIPGESPKAPTQAANGNVASTRSAEFVSAADTLAGVVKAWQGGDADAVGKLVVFTTPSVEKNMLEVVRAKKNSPIRYEPIEWKTEGAVVCGIMQLVMTPDQTATIRPTNYFVRRDGRWRMLMGELKDAKGAMTAEEASAAAKLSGWADDWKRSHPVPTAGEGLPTPPR